MTGQVWEVVGGADKGGILVRQGKDPASPEEATRLSTGALVRELELDGERLRYQRLSSSGPETGWVTTRLSSGKDLLVKSDKPPPVQIYDVVGGGEKGGIVVRQGQDLTSEQAPERLATGARVRELELVGERLRYEKVCGGGPDTGWVSLRTNDKPLLLKVPLDPEFATCWSLQVPESTEPVVGRKVRILAVPSGPSNSNIMKFQTMQLRQSLSDVDIRIIEPPTPWEPIPGSTHPSETERSDFEKMIAKDKPITQWYSYSYHMQNREESDVWEHVEECCDYIMDFISREGPFDVLVSYAAGCTMTSMLIEMLRRQDKEVPWRLSIYFCGGNIDDFRYQFPQMSAHPVLYVAGGEKDDLYRWSTMLVTKMFTNLLVLGHEDGALFPTSQPRCAEIYAQIAAEVRKFTRNPSMK